jgi:hypothetical protein
MQVLCAEWGSLQKDFPKLRGTQLLRLVTAVHSTLDRLET